MRVMAGDDVLRAGLVIGPREHSRRGNPLGGDTVPTVLTSAPCEVLVCADRSPDRGD
ncbi:MAG: hypothetical protein ACRDYV_08975 [Acidimicrobiia bacterium]